MEKFFEQKPESVKSPEKEINKAVFILYPDARTIGLSQEGSILCQNVIERYEKILKIYKEKNGFKIIGVIYNDTLPNNFSQLYSQKNFDMLLPVATDLKGWSHQKHEQLLNEALKKVNLSKEAKIILGGYHAEDCVLTMGKILKEKSLKPKINAELTEKAGLFSVIKEMNKVHSLNLVGVPKEVMDISKEQIEENKEMKREEIRKIASLLKK